MIRLGCGTGGWPDSTCHGANSLCPVRARKMAREGSRWSSRLKSGVPGSGRMRERIRGSAVGANRVLFWFHRHFQDGFGIRTICDPTLPAKIAGRMGHPQCWVGVDSQRTGRRVGHPPIRLRFSRGSLLRLREFRHTQNIPVWVLKPGDFRAVR
jgi:hypothetical protein